MALIVVTWDLPANQDQIEQYTAKSNEWGQDILQRPGLVQWCAYRNPLSATPQVMAIQEYDSLESARAWLDTDRMKQVIAEMRDSGCSNFTIQLWDQSPIIPEPIRP